MGKSEYHHSDNQGTTYSPSELFYAKRVGNTVVFEPAALLLTPNNLHTIKDTFSSGDKDDPGVEMSSKTLGRIEFWIGIAVGVIAIVGSAVTVTWSVSSAITSKNDSLRTELNQNITTSKQEIGARIDRLEDKVDGGFKDLSTNLGDLKVILLTQKNEKSETK
ncbi:TPA: hypothetical protein MNI86_005440 [Klebsiella pneumoniae]|uniref:hypothetical protein n=1 Tax=Klebsiella pneumoniae TaxID=573 RepID=UPI0033053A21|nr:hypothetical protein [Klebsiella pneumoniae]HCA0861291.1 hypothetical protein [Klebsiella pneumoniae]HCM3157427.1 hypothetical protein [Klebsiella quasipneumoniae subsp. similipneumoniae]HCM7882009.1 hypothetical protein [Klebsiella quasipneumoniae]HCM8036302.1 hypothetical protein [Klebsiella quasipneumoniae]